MLQSAVKFELVCGVELAQAGNELAAEHAAKNFHGQEKVVPSWNPAAVVRGQAAGRNDAVDMGVMAPTPTIP